MVIVLVFVSPSVPRPRWVAPIGFSPVFRRLDIFISRFVEVQHAADNEHRKLQEELVQKFLKLRESFVEKETLGFPFF